MPRRWSSLAVVAVLAVGCTSAKAPVGDPPAAPPGASTTATTVATTTTTTTVPVAADVADLMSATTMTDRARRIFLAADPHIEDAATFATNCGPDATATPGAAPVHTQGCYERGHIHLLAADRADAREVLYVVAAHELLHAVYASLAPADRARIDAELEAARVGNDRLTERLKAYGDGPTLTNEVHSILGSEFDGLPPALEAHYAQFFVDRAKVVAARRDTLGRREDEIARLKAEVGALDARITALKDGQAALRASGDIRTYNANVALINGLITQYDSKIDDLNARIDDYN
ncbi:MAG: hypothetical protein M3066_00550, partial [Actinomycetota bacterium]|nr:hypothetical protein [Actinomycetota bacterium]